MASGTEVTLFSTHADGNGLSVEPSREPYELVLFAASNGSLAGARRISKAIRARATDFDLIHIHSFWNFTVTWAAAAARNLNPAYDPHTGVKNQPVHQPPPQGDFLW